MAGSAPHPKAGQPVGLLVDTRSADRPGVITLRGRFGYLESLKTGHAESLWQAVRDQDALWTYMYDGPFTHETAFAAWIAACATSDDPRFYVILDDKDRALGIAALMAIHETYRVIEVGNILYAPALQRTPLATEAQYLLARYVFENLGYRRYEWKCNALNASSRLAALRLGFAFEGIFRQHRIVKGRNRDTAWFSMLDSEWPTRKASFERWLAPENFTSGGQQKSGLSTINGVAE
jgi:RimJ/RimL family protein N-acetyltransferase